jgi:hypothetical protein
MAAAGWAAYPIRQPDDTWPRRLVGDGRFEAEANFAAHGLAKVFQPYSSEVFILSLPHHGSNYDFDEEILDFSGLALTVATTIKDRGRVANLQMTLDAVTRKKKSYKIVDDKPESDLAIACARTMKRI